MRKKAWSYQIKSQVKKHGKAKASWHVGWHDLDGQRKSKSCGPGARGKRDAEKLADTIHSQLVTGTYQSNERKTWQEFRELYELQIISSMDPKPAREVRNSLRTFDRIIRPNLMRFIDSKKVDEFVAKRRKEKGRIKKTLSPATVNKELRFIRAALNVAHDWDFLVKVPKIRFLRESKKLPTYAPPEHFAAIYEACETAKFPNGVPNVMPCDWWRGLLTTGYMTGWRIGQLLALAWDDIDLDGATALSQAEDNKGKRDAKIPLHPVVVEHLRKLAGSFDTHVFPWNLHERTLWVQFNRIQANAKVVGPEGKEKPMPKCGKEGWYGFHDLRRGFATENAAGMNLFELQTLMQHKSLETTKLYVSMVGRLNKAVDGLYVPEVLKSAALR